MCKNHNAKKAPNHAEMAPNFQQLCGIMRKISISTKIEKLKNAKKNCKKSKKCEKLENHAKIAPSSKNCAEIENARKRQQQKCAFWKNQKKHRKFAKMRKYMRNILPLNMCPREKKAKQKKGSKSTKNAKVHSFS